MEGEGAEWVRGEAVHGAEHRQLRLQIYELAQNRYTH